MEFTYGGLNYELLTSVSFHTNYDAYTDRTLLNR